MKRTSYSTSSSSRSGFTLIELLVVMGIIAILAGVLFPVATSAINAAKRAKASALASQVQTAVLGYNTEYSVYPVPSTAATSADFLISDSDTTYWPGFLYALCGNVNPYDSSTTAPSNPVSNTRAIQFLTLKSSDVDNKNGLKNPITPSTANNPYFNVALDYDYDNIVGDSGTASGKLPDFTNSTTSTMKYLATGTTAGVAVWANCNTSTTTTNPSFYVHTY